MKRRRTRDDRAPRIRRLVELIGLLQSGRGHNSRTLADSCGVSRRTVFRDLDVLREAGVPLEFDEQLQIFRIPGNRYLPSTSFTPQETLALMILCQNLGDRAGLPFAGPARTAALKLESTLPRALRDYLRDVTPAVRIKPSPSNPLRHSEEVFGQLLDGIARRCCLRMQYDSHFEDARIQTKLSAYQLLFSRRSWYVVGRSSIHASVRTFNVGRIHSLEPLEDGFRVPRGFSLDRYFRNAWHLIPEPGPDQEVVVRFAPLVARNVAEVAWHKTQQLHWNDDGTLDFTVTVSGLGEISWWILGYGDQARVIAPAALRTLIARHAARMLDHYASTGSLPAGPNEEKSAAESPGLKRKRASGRHLAG